MSGTQQAKVQVDGRSATPQSLSNQPEIAEQQPGGEPTSETEQNKTSVQPVEKRQTSGASAPAVVLTNKPGGAAQSKLMATFRSAPKPARQELTTIPGAREPAKFPSAIAFRDLSVFSGHEFRENAARLIAGHTGLAPDFSCMTPEQGKIFLEELATNTGGHLQEVTLLPRNIDVPMKTLADALTGLARNHPQAQVDLNFSGRKLDANAGAALADAIANSGVSTLTLDSSMLGTPDGAGAILKALPDSKVRKLEVMGKGVNGCADAIATLVPQLAKLEVSSIDVDDEAKAKINGACIDAGKPGIVRWHDATQEIIATDSALISSAGLAPDSFRQVAGEVIRTHNNLRADLYYMADENPFVQTLEQRNNAVRNKEVLLEELARSDVRHLRIVGFQLYDLPQLPEETLNTITAMSRNNPELKLALVFNGTQLGPTGGQIVAQALPGAKVATLQLDRTGLNAECTRAIAEAAGRSEVENLDLCNNVFDDSSTAALAAALPRLASLTLTGADFTEAQRGVINKAYKDDCDANKTRLVWN